MHAYVWLSPFAIHLKMYAFWCWENVALYGRAGISANVGVWSSLMQTPDAQ